MEYCLCAEIGPRRLCQSITIKTIYLVNNFRQLGTAFTETDVEQANLETVITDLMSGQYSDPVRVVAFNTAEH